MIMPLALRSETSLVGLAAAEPFSLASPFNNKEATTTMTTTTMMFLPHHKIIKLLQNRCNYSE